MNTGKIIKITALMAALSLSIITGFAYANQKQAQDNIAPYIDNGFTPKGHAWARDTAVEYLELTSQGQWIERDVTNPELLGASIIEYTSDDLVVTVSHCLNPTADYDVTVVVPSFFHSYCISIVEDTVNVCVDNSFFDCFFFRVNILRVDRCRK